MKIFDYVNWDNWPNQSGIDHWKSLVKYFDETFNTLEECSSHEINFSSRMWKELERASLLYELSKINDERCKKLNFILND